MESTFRYALLAALVLAGCEGSGDDRAPGCPDVIEEGTACAGEATCTWGGMACRCGTCNPALGCSCIDGSWVCWHTDPFPEELCPDAVQQDVQEAETVETSLDAVADSDATSASCPAEAPIGTQETCASDTRCEYGIECCCGNCYPSIVCQCADDTWACHATDACMIPGCPDAGETP